MAEKLSKERLLEVRETARFGEIYLKESEVCSMIEEIISLRQHNNLLTVATAAMQGLLSNPNYLEIAANVGNSKNILDSEIIVAIMAKGYALAVIAECEKITNKETK